MPLPWEPEEDENGALYWITKGEFDKCIQIGSPAVRPLISALKDQLGYPKIIRAVESRLVLEPRFASAIATLEVGQHLLVVYHLHRAVQWQDHHLKELFTRRIACRPNLIGVTLTRIVAFSGSTITVVGLDAINGMPILDIKPYKPIFDVPPVHPAERELKSKRNRGITTLFRKRKNLPTTIPGKYNRPVVVLTGGPGGGKSTLQTELANDAEWPGRFVALPEAVQYARFVNISPSEKLFQRMAESRN